MVSRIQLSSILHAKTNRQFLALMLEMEYRHGICSRIQNPVLIANSYSHTSTIDYAICQYSMYIAYLSNVVKFNNLSAVLVLVI